MQTLRLFRRADACDRRPNRLVSYDQQRIKAKGMYGCDLIDGTTGRRLHIAMVHDARKSCKVSTRTSDANHNSVRKPPW